MSVQINKIIQTIDLIAPENELAAAIVVVSVIARKVMDSAACIFHAWWLQHRPIPQWDYQYFSCTIVWCMWWLVWVHMYSLLSYNCVGMHGSPTSCTNGIYGKCPPAKWRALAAAVLWIRPHSGTKRITGSQLRIPPSNDMSQQSHAGNPMARPQFMVYRCWWPQKPNVRAEVHAFMGAVIGPI